MKDKTVEEPSYISCPLAKDEKPIIECKTCKYRDDCIEDLLRDFEGDVMKLIGKVIKVIREIIKKHEIK